MNAIAVGRGTDLLLYLLVVGSMFAVVILTNRLMSISTHVRRHLRIIGLDQLLNDRIESADAP